MQYSVDQVPPPILIGIDVILDKKGRHGHARFSQPGALPEKNLLSIKLYLPQRGIQPNITFLIEPFKNEC